MRGHRTTSHLIISLTVDYEMACNVSRDAALGVMALRVIVDQAAGKNDGALVLGKAGQAQDDALLCAAPMKDSGYVLTIGQKRLPDAGQAYAVAGLEVAGGGFVNDKRQQAPIHEVAAVALGGVLSGDVGPSAQHFLAGRGLFPG